MAAKEIHSTVYERVYSHVTCIFSAYRKESLTYCSPSAVSFPRAITSAPKTLPLPALSPTSPHSLAEANHLIGPEFPLPEFPLASWGGNGVAGDLLMGGDLVERDLKPKWVQGGLGFCNLGQTHLAAREWGGGGGGGDE